MKNLFNFLFRRWVVRSFCLVVVLGFGFFILFCRRFRYFLFFFIFDLNRLRYFYSISYVFSIKYFCYLLVWGVVRFFRSYFEFRGLWCWESLVC